MKNYLNVFLTCLVICLTLSTVMGFMKKKAADEKIKAAAGPNSDTNILKTLFYDNYITSILPNDGKMIDPEIVLRNSTAVVTNLKQVTGKKNTLIFRFSYRDCSECVNSVLHSLEKTFKEQLKTRVILITDAYSEKDFLLKTQSYNSPFSIYAIDDSGFGLSLENKNLPFLFVLSSDNKLIKPYIPFKELPEDIDRYNEYIGEWLTNTKN